MTQPTFRDPFAAGILAAPALAEWLFHHYNVVVVSDPDDADGLTRVAHLGPRLEPAALGPFYGAIAGLPQDGVLVSRLGLGVLPLPIPGRRHPNQLRIEFIGHPVFFLPPAVRDRRANEGVDGYAARLWCELEVRSVADVAQGTTLDLLEVSGIDVSDPSSRRRLEAWAAGAKDDALDALSLPGPGAPKRQFSSYLAERQAELSEQEQTTSALLSSLVNSLAGLATAGPDELLAELDETVAALDHQAPAEWGVIVDAATAAVAAVKTAADAAHLLGCVQRAVAEGKRWPNFADMGPVRDGVRDISRAIAAAIKSDPGIVGLAEVRRLALQTIAPCLGIVAKTVAALSPGGGGGSS